jgi:hypothetical protein
MSGHPEERLLTRLGIGLRAVAAADYELAAAVVDGAVPNVSSLGGSHAQNQLFDEICELSCRRARSATAAAA